MKVKTKYGIKHTNPTTKVTISMSSVEATQLLKTLNLVDLGFLTNDVCLLDKEAVSYFKTIEKLRDSLAEEVR